MPTTDRRTFLAGAALASSGVLLPGTAEAAPRVRAQAAALRERWALQKRDFLDVTWADRPNGVDPGLGAHAEALGDGLGAFSTFKELEAVPVEDQAHPAMQALLRDATRAIGGSVVACRELLEAYVEGVDDDPDRETHLRAALRSVRLGLADWRTTGGRQRALEQALLGMEGEDDPGRLLRRARRELARMRRTEELAARIAERQGETGLLDVTNPGTLARFEAGRARWAAEGESAGEPLPLPDEQPLPEARRSAGLVVLGILVIGAGVVVGGFILLLGVCALSCGDGATGVIALLLGIGVIGVAIWGGVALIRKGSRRSLSESTPPPDDHLGPHRLREERAVAVLAAERWVPSGARRDAGTILVVQAGGLVRRPGGWLADPDGNGVVAGEDAPVRGAPVGALVGRVGDDTFFVGRDGRIPDGPDGALELAVNLPAGGAPGKGHFVAHVAVYEPAYAGA